MFPTYRRVALLGWTQQTAEATKQLGFPAIFSGIRISNVAALFFAKNLGWTRAGGIEKFGWFQGDLDDMVIWTRRQENAAEAMRQACLRATYYRENPTASTLKINKEEEATWRSVRRLRD